VPQFDILYTVTEIAYHKRNTIDADIEFLTKEEWLTELDVLLADLMDEEGNLKHASGMRNDAGVAWHKVRKKQRAVNNNDSTLHRSMPSILHSLRNNLSA
jgi:hypothetical protein